MYCTKSILMGSKFVEFCRHKFQRRIKMDFMIFMIFALACNYCFIDGCRSKETNVKISVSNDAGSTKSAHFEQRNSRGLATDYETVPASIASAYQMLPYSYPIPSVYFPTFDVGNAGYYHQNEHPQYIQPQPSPQIPSGPALIQPSQIPPHIESVQTAPVEVPSEERQPTSFSSIPGYQDVRNPQNADSFSTFQNVNYQNFPRPYNPCEGRICRPGTKCVVRRNPSCPRCPLIAGCVDPCETVRCASGYVCRAEVGSCGTPFCEPRAICKDLCEGIVCPGNNTCTLVTLSCPSNCDLVPICGRDPCETTICPLGQGCYLQETFCSRPPCTVEPVCRDPCKDVRCGPGEFCYTEDVQCIKAPCNPIPICKNPCASVLCPAGQQCVLEQAFCIRTPCNPIAVCKPV